jgi:K+-sensing histidine kinase KdpD
VDDLYFRAEISAGTLQVHCSCFNLSDLLGEIFTTIERMYPDQLEMQYGPLPKVYADADHVRKILLNLLHNAMRSSSPGNGGLFRLAATADLSQPRVNVSIQDRAPELTSAYREAIFAPAVELPSEFGRPRLGLGLGLFVGRIIARKMGGDLVLAETSDDLVGNVFVLSLRVAQAP